MKHSIPRLIFSLLVLTALLMPASSRAAPGTPEVYVVFAIDTEADNGHPLSQLHPVFNLSSYDRVDCLPFPAKRSTDGLTWTTYTDGTVFNFIAASAGQTEPVTGFQCGNTTNFGNLYYFSRAVAFTVPADGVYDIRVQLAVTGVPTQTASVHVVTDLGGDPNLDDKLSTYTAEYGGFTSGDYVLIAQSLPLLAGQTYWWVADRSCSNEDNCFSVYRGISGSDYTSTIGQIMDPSFRLATLDSYGNPLKMSWFMEMDNFINSGFTQGGEPLDYLSLYDRLLETWAAEIDTYGDEIAYHHHFMTWTGTTWEKRGHEHASDGLYDWHNQALDRMLLDAGFYPSLFRAGWLNNHNQLQAWVERNFLADYGGMMWGGTVWAPYHPSELDYHLPGDMSHWIANCPGLPTPDGVNAAFTQAQAENGPVIYCVYAHQMDNMRGFAEKLSAFLAEAALLHPGVNYRYATALEALQAYIGATDTTPPQLQIAQDSPGLFTVTSDEPLLGQNPYIAARFGPASWAFYQHYPVVPGGLPNTWTVEIPSQTLGLPLIEVAAGGLDLSGNSSTALWSAGLPAFSARKQAGGVMLAWETTTELDLVEFNLYRAEVPDFASAERLNPDPIPAAFAGTPQGGEYQYLDSGASVETTYYFWLELVRTDFSTIQIGPLIVWGQSVFLPLIRVSPLSLSGYD